MGKTVLAEKDFFADAPRERVWRLIGKVIFSVLPGMEKMEILDENNFRAVLRVKMFGVEWPLRLKGEMTDLSPPESFSVKLFLEGAGGWVQAGQKVSISLAPAEGSKTSVVCRATLEEMGVLARVLFSGRARAFAQSTFEAIEKRLKELTS